MAKLKGTVADEMLVLRHAAMKGALGENPKTAKHGFASRMGVAYTLRKCLEDTKEYMYDRAQAEKNGSHFRKDPGMENMALVLEKKMPLHLHVHRSDDICTAIRIGKEQGKGAVALRGKMIDAPIVARAQQTIAAAEALGLGRRDGE